MYELVFESKDSEKELKVLLPSTPKTLRIGLAKWDGKSKPKYLWMILSGKTISSKLLKDIEIYLWYWNLKKINCFKPDTDAEIDYTILVPDNFINLHKEEGDLVVYYGDILYADEAY